MSRISRHLTFANIVSVVALFAALGLGTAWALDANSVKSKHIVNGQVKKRDLGVPAKYTSAGLTDESGPCEPGNEWRDLTFFNQEVGFYRDPFGIVHLQGTAIQCGATSGTIFSLPPGFRPEGLVDTFGSKNQTDPHQVRIIDSGGEVAATTPGIGPGNTISLENISFRCAPSGENGCP